MKFLPAVVTISSVLVRDLGRIELMGVKVTFVSNKIDIQKSDAELLLLLFQSAAYNCPVFPSSYRLHIEEQEFAFRVEGYKINRSLLDERGVHIAAL